MAVTALSLLKGYFTCDDEAVKNKYYNLLESFFHKSEGNLVTGTAVVGDALVFSFSDGSTQGVPLLPDTVPVSFVEGLQDFLNNKVDKVQGKGLSTEDFTNTLKQKLEELQNYVHPDFHQIGEITGLPEALDSKVDKVEGKELSSNDFTTGEKETLATVEGHVQNEDIHVTAAQKKTYANKLKTYVSGEVLDDLVGDIFRIFGNKIYSLNAALPYTTNDIEAEAEDGDWTVELAAPEAGLTFKDADGIDQFTGSFALFEGFGFDAATKTLINPVVVPRFGVSERLDFGENAGSNSWPPDGNRLVLRQLDSGTSLTTFEMYARGRQGKVPAKIDIAVTNTLNTSNLDDAAKTVVFELLASLAKCNIQFQAEDVIAVNGFQTNHNAATGVKSILRHRDGNQGHDIDIEVNTGVTSNIKILKIRNEGKYSGRKSLTHFILKNNNETEIIVLELSPDNGGQSTFKGSLKMDGLDLSALGKYADDAAAGAAGVPINFAYINTATGAVHSRQS